MTCLQPGVRMARNASLGSLHREIPTLAPHPQPTSRKLAYRTSAASMTEVAVKRLEKQDLVNYIASGCKPQSHFRCTGPI